MLSQLGSMASIIGMLVSLLIYLKVRKNRKFYVDKRYLEITKKRISEILEINQDKLDQQAQLKKKLTRY